MARSDSGRAATRSHSATGRVAAIPLLIWLFRDRSNHPRRGLWPRLPLSKEGSQRIVCFQHAADRSRFFPVFPRSLLLIEPQSSLPAIRAIQMKAPGHLSAVGRNDGLAPSRNLPSSERKSDSTESHLSRFICADPGP